jgi:hypothetical protein
MKHLADKRRQAKKMRTWLLTGLFIVIFLASCREAHDLLPAAERILIVYLGGDNDLSSETYQKTEALKLGWTAENNHRHRLFIYRDAAIAAPMLMEINSRNGQTVVDTVEVYGEENSASAEVFARTVNKIRNKYPSKSYGLLFFSHASGWLPQGALTNPELRSVGMDKNKEMELADFARAIPDKTFEYIVFEACFMAGVEILCELRNKTDYILASSAEIVSPGFTAIYLTSLGFLLNGNLTAFAEQAFDYFNLQIGVMKSATFSIIKTDGVQALAEFVAENCHLDKQLDVRKIQHFDRFQSYRLFFDFEHYYSQLLDSDEENRTLQILIDKCVVWKKATPSFLSGSSGFVINKYSGMTGYIPQDGFPALNLKYEETEWRRLTTGR